MTTNPNNSVGTNAAYEGRTSVNAFNDVLGLLPRGVLSGWACAPDTGLTVTLGGDGETRDVAIAEDNIGNKTTVNNISNTPISVTLGAAPASNSRIDLIVGYVDNPPNGVSTEADNPGACGLIVVEGTAAATPVPPNDSDIRTAITADGASGTTAYYVVLAQITIASGTTDIVADDIVAGAPTGITNDKITPAIKQIDIYFLIHDGSKIGPKQATLIKLPGDIGILTYAGGTGWNDSGEGYRHLRIDITGAAFERTLGYSLNSCYTGNSIAYQTYSHTESGLLGSWVYKETGVTQERLCNFVAIGSFNL